MSRTVAVSSGLQRERVGFLEQGGRPVVEAGDRAERGDHAHLFGHRRRRGVRGGLDARVHLGVVVLDGLEEHLDDVAVAAHQSEEVEVVEDLARRPT